MKTYTDYDINIRLQDYNHALPYDDEGGLEAALARATGVRPRRKMGRTVALLAACAVLLTLSVFAKDIVEIVARVQEHYSFKTESISVSVVDKVMDNRTGLPMANSYYRAAWHNQSYLIYNPQHYEGFMEDGESILHTFTTLEAVQALVVYPLITLDIPGAPLSEGIVSEWPQGCFNEGAFIEYRESDGPAGIRHGLSQRYVGPNFTMSVQTTMDYEPVTLAGVEGIMKRHEYPEDSGAPCLDLTVFEFVCNRLYLTMSLMLPYEDAAALAEQALAQAQAIDWDAVETGLDRSKGGFYTNGQQYLLYDPTDYNASMHYDHKCSTLAETQALVPYPLIEMAVPGADFYRGTVNEYRFGCYREGAVLTYRQKVEGSDIRAYLYQQYRGPAYTGSLTFGEAADYRPLTVLGQEGLWAPREPEPHSADPQRVEFRFLVNRLELHIDLPMSFDEALPLVEQVLRDALAIDWDAVEAGLAR